MKKRLTAICMGIIFLGFAGLAQASLTTIGTATYGGSDYNLIYDDDDTGFGGGGLVWLDYRKSKDSLGNLRTWSAVLGAQLIINLNPGYTTNIDWTTGWRLPDTPDEKEGLSVYGFNGDPDNDGKYAYNYGYNLGDSEMGHLFHEELGNIGQKKIDGTNNNSWEYGLENQGDFQHLYEGYYWSGSTVTYMGYYGTQFNLGVGMQTQYTYGTNTAYGIAVHSGQVTQSPVPVPGAIWLLGSGIIGLIMFSRKKI